MNEIIIKTQEQIDGIRRSCKLAAQCLKYIEPHVIPGVTTGELDYLIHMWMLKNDATPATLGYQSPIGLVYHNACCISVNDVICHGVPGEYKLKQGDIVNIDVTTILDGYYGDTSTMFALEPDLRAQKMLAVAKECLEIGIRQVKPDNFFSNIGYWIDRCARSNGCSVVEQFCGHGVGLAFHEEPQVCHHYAMKRYTGPQMKPGMIFTIEPMINEGIPDVLIESDGWTAKTKDGKLSAQYEHTILVHENGVEIFTLL